MFMRTLRAVNTKLQRSLKTRFIRLTFPLSDEVFQRQRRRIGEVIHLNANPEEPRMERVHLKREYYARFMDKILYYVHWDLAASHMRPSEFLPFLRHHIAHVQAEAAAEAEAVAIEN